MSKKTWIIGGAVVVALIGATVIGRSLTGDKKQIRFWKGNNIKSCPYSKLCSL